MSIVLLVVVIMLTLLFPILLIPVNLLGLIFARGKIRKTYGVLLAFSLAMMAYIWIPGESSDLYRHHNQVKLLTNYDVAQLWVYIRANLEPLHYLMNFLVAQTDTYNLLQFFVVLIGYSELFWLFCDFTEQRGVKKSIFALLLVYVFSSVRFIDFASGLWCNLAIINTALGVYLYYFRKTKYFHYLFYLLAGCLHIGTLYIIVLVLIFSKVSVFKKKRLVVAALTIATLLSFGGIMSLVSNFFGVDSSFSAIVNNMYNSYFLNDEKFGTLHTGWNLVFPVINIVFCSLLALRKTNNEMDEYASFVMYLAIAILTTLTNAGVFLRYGFLLVILMIPLIVDFMENVEKKQLKIILTTSILAMTAIQLARSCGQMETAGLTSQLKKNLTTTTVYMLEQGKL